MARSALVTPVRVLVHSQHLTFHLLDGLTSVPDAGHFFVGWGKRPTQAVFENLLRRATHVVLAIDDETRAVIGFATAISDQVLSGYIPLVEVIPEWQGNGVGTALVGRLLELMSDLYMIDLVCDSGLVPFYERFGMKQGTAMSLRRYEHQAGQDRPAQPDA